MLLPLRLLISVKEANAQFKNNSAYAKVKTSQVLHTIQLRRKIFAGITISAVMHFKSALSGSDLTDGKRCELETVLKD